MPVRRDKNGNYYYRVKVQLPDGTHKRIFETPAKYPGLGNTRAGCQEAELRAMSEARSGKVAKTEAQPKEVKAKTIKEHADNFVAM